MNIDQKNDLISKFMDNEKIKHVYKDNNGNIQFMDYKTPEYQKSYTKIFNVINKLNTLGYNININTGVDKDNLYEEIIVNLSENHPKYINQPKDIPIYQCFEFKNNISLLKTKLFNCIIFTINHYNNL